MTADWYLFHLSYFGRRLLIFFFPFVCNFSRYVFPAEVLRRISSRITNEVVGINRVTYDISSKPPAVCAQVLCLLQNTEMFFLLSPDRGVAVNV